MHIYDTEIRKLIFGDNKPLKLKIILCSSAWSWSVLDKIHDMVLDYKCIYIFSLTNIFLK